MRKKILYHACIDNEIEMVEFFLIFDKIDVNKYEYKSGKTPLIGAIMKGHVKIAELLINYPKTDINCKDFDENTPLTMDVKNNLKDIIDLLIKNERFNPKESRLNHAFLISTGDISKQLIHLENLDINHVFIGEENEENIIQTFLTNSADKKDVDKIDLILNHPLFDKEKSNIFDALLISIKNNDVVIFNKLIDIYSKTNINRGEEILLYAIQHSSNEIIKAINDNQKFGNTFLEID